MFLRILTVLILSDVSVTYRYIFIIFSDHDETTKIIASLRQILLNSPITRDIQPHGTGNLLIYFKTNAVIHCHYFQHRSIEFPAYKLCEH